MIKDTGTKEELQDLEPDSEVYFQKIRELKKLLGTPDKDQPSYYAMVPETQLTWIRIVKKRWFGLLPDKEEYIRGLKLLTPLAFWSQELQMWVIELAGVVSDGASTPQLLWSLFPPLARKKSANYVPAAIGHDKYCRQGKKGMSPINSRKTHALFGTMMSVFDVRKVTRWAMSRAVKYFGPRFEADPCSPELTQA